MGDPGPSPHPTLHRVEPFNQGGYYNYGTSPYAAPYQPYVGDKTYGPWTYQAAGFAYPVPYQYPDTASGKLIINTGSGIASCSASVVNTLGGNNVVTAGHCVNPGGGSGTPQAFYPQVTFIPAYNASASIPMPYGEFPATSATTTGQWYYHGSFHDDFAVVTLGPNANGQTVQSLTGSLGIQFRAPEQQRNLIQTGYPVDQGGANILFFCQHDLATREFYGQAPAQALEISDGSEYGAACPGGGGMSGAPYRGYSPEFGSNTVFTVRSYHDPSNETHRYGPYLGGEAEIVFEYANPQ